MLESHQEVNAALQQVLGLDAANFPPPFQRTLGYRWTAYEAKRFLHAEVDLPKELAGPHAVWTMGTCAGVWEWVALTFAQLIAQRHCMTLTFEFSGLRHPHADGQPLTVEAQIRATRKSIIFVEGVVRGADRQVVLNASASFAALKSRPGDRDQG
jgi:acyl-coenzyme A thioesterase PaaI-like protein